MDALRSSARGRVTINRGESHGPSAGHDPRHTGGVESLRDRTEILEWRPRSTPIRSSCSSLRACKDCSAFTERLDGGDLPGLTAEGRQKWVLGRPFRRMRPFERRSSLTCGGGKALTLPTVAFRGHTSNREDADEKAMG